MIKYIFLLLTLFLFTSCSYMIGGNCNYQSTQGTVLIKSKNDNTCLANFFPQLLTYDVEFTCSDDIKVGNTYPAILKKASHSSCTPYILNLDKK